MSEELIRLYRESAATGATFHGLTILSHKEQIGELIKQYGARTVLDYGSGRGDQYEEPHLLHQYWNVEKPTLYDPAFEHSEKPEGMFDAVVCSDVLEHLPMDEVGAFVGELFKHARLFVWASVCCRPAKKKFDNGWNMHLTVQGFWWWQAKFVKWSKGKPYTLVETR